MIRNAVASMGLSLFLVSLAGGQTTQSEMPREAADGPFAHDRPGRAT